jgi:hypothetical protein
MVSAVLNTPAFIPLTLFCTLFFAATWVLASRLIARSYDLQVVAVESALAPLLWGLGLPLVATILDMGAFWCSAPPLAALGLGLGSTTAAYSLARVLSPASSSGRENRAGEWDRLLIVAAAVVIPLVLLPSWSRPGGDEPHYLVTAHSIWYDGSLDLADDYAARVYEPFHPDALAPHTKPGRDPDSRFTMHGIGLPLLVLPAYLAGRQMGGGEWSVALPRALLIGLYGVFAWSLFGLIAETAGRRAARAGTSATVLLAPLVFAPLHLFPAVPAMLLSCAGYRGVRSARDPWRLFLSATALAVLPWIGVKFIPLAATIIVVGLLRRASIGRPTRALVTASPLLVSLVGHAVLMWVLYGTFSPASAYLGAPAASATVPALGANWGAYLGAWPGALATIVGYLLDQKEGLLAYGPHFLLASAGIPWLWRQRRTDLLALAAMLLAYVGPYALSQQLSGQGPPVRPLLAILWTLSPALGVALALCGRASRVFTSARGILLALAACLTMVYASRPELLPHDYPVKSSRLLRAYAPHGADWWHFFPQWVNVDEARWGVAFFWALVACVAVAALVRAGSRLPLRAAQTDARPPVGWLSAVATMVLLCGLVLVHHSAIVVTGLHRGTVMKSGLTAWILDESPVHTWGEAEGIWTRPGRAGTLVFTSDEAIEEAEVRLGSLVETDVELDLHGARVRGKARPDEPLSANLHLQRGWRTRDGYAYHCRLLAEKGISPALRGDSRDERYLGVFLSFTRLELRLPGK